MSLMKDYLLLKFLTILGLRTLKKSIICQKLLLLNKKRKRQKNPRLLDPILKKKPMDMRVEITDQPPK
jgi:hypothetical protein